MEGEPCYILWSIFMSPSVVWTRSERRRNSFTSFSSFGKRSESFLGFSGWLVTGGWGVEKGGEEKTPSSSSFRVHIYYCMLQILHREGKFSFIQETTEFGFREADKGTNIYTPRPWRMTPHQSSQLPCPVPSLSHRSPKLKMSPCPARFLTFTRPLTSLPSLRTEHSSVLALSKGLPFIRPVEVILIQVYN